MIRSVLHGKHYVSATEPDHLMLFTARTTRNTQIQNAEVGDYWVPFPSPLTTGRVEFIQIVYKDSVRTSQEQGGPVVMNPLLCVEDSLSRVRPPTVSPPRIFWPLALAALNCFHTPWRHISVWYAAPEESVKMAPHFVLNHRAVKTYGGNGGISLPFRVLALEGGECLGWSPLGEKAFGSDCIRSWVGLDAVPYGNLLWIGAQRVTRR
jgi:hypothetical protein